MPPIPRRRGRSRTPDGRPHPVDVHVGQRIRLRRTLLGWSQEKLGRTLGLTFQQVQKYERGANRVGASRLYELSRILEVPVAYFFEDIGADAMIRSSPQPAAKTADGEGIGAMARRETLELMRAYYRIPDPKVRRQVFEMTKALARESR
ncbi:MAG: helix-turn-helix transcriptional regulator [Rhodospirillales bacterium]|nr:helix-turn-helix transcriptional regulator [Rhodospirillales bacterium]